MPSGDATSLWRGRSALVTGASGYVAGALTTRLLAAGASVLRLSRRPLTPLPGCVDVVGDMGDAGLWIDLAGRVDTIFHLAGETSLYAAERDPLGSLAANVIPVLHAIAASRKAASRPFLVLAGTVTQFGLCGTDPVDETCPDRPVTVYDLHKLAAEQHVLMAARDGGIRGCCLRLANVYGAGPNPNGALDRGILNKVVRNALIGQAVTIFGDGREIRDYVYLDDVAAAFMAAAQASDACTGRAFVVSSGEATPFGDAFRMAVSRVERKIGKAVPIQYAPWPPGMLPIEFRNFVGNVSALTRASGWRPALCLADGLDLTIEAFHSELLA